MSDRRRRTAGRGGKRRARRGGCLFVFLAAALGAGAVYCGVPQAVLDLAGIRSVNQVISRLAGETADGGSGAGSGEAEVFRELAVPEKDVEGGFYYQQLPESERTVYRELLQGVNGMEERILLHTESGADPAKVYEYLLYDRPELFWCDGNSRMTVYSDRTEFYPGYTCSAQEREERQGQIEAAAADCLAGIPAEASEYDRIRSVYEYIVNTVDYDESAPDNQNIYSALVGKRSVCAGYSRAAQYLLAAQGIGCIYVVGTVEGQGAHAWNIVTCGGRYYQMDVTFADPVFCSEESGEEIPGNIISYDYLCCTDEEMLTDHIQSREVPYPACDSDDLDYYRMNGMYYETYDPGILLSAMNESIFAGEETFVCKFPDEAVYDEAREGLTGDLYPKAARTVADVYGLQSVRYTYVENRDHCRMTVVWETKTG